MKKILLIITVCISICSCGYEGSELNRTIFIPDENDHNLPAYTEWGYNSFGAVYERTYYLASEVYLPCKIMYRNDSLRLLLTGVLSESILPKKLELLFAFPSEPVNSYNDLLPLHNRRVDLKTETEVQMTTGDGVTNVLDIISGEFYFKRVQLLSVDEKENRVILSGTFYLTYRTDNGFSSSFSNGRFDFGIDKLYNN